MIYTDLLNKTIDNSGLKNIEIVEKLKEKGISITPNYLSVLRNDSNKTGSEELNKAISEICEAKYIDALNVQAYLDRADNTLKEYVKYTLDLVTQGATAFSTTVDADKAKNGMDKLNSLSDAEIICDILENKEYDDYDYSNIEYVMVPKMPYFPVKIVDKDGKEIK